MPNILTDDVTLNNDNARIELLAKEVKSIFDSVEDVDSLTDEQFKLIVDKDKEIKLLEAKVDDRLKKLDAKIMAEGTIKRYAEITRPNQYKSKSKDEEKKEAYVSPADAFFENADVKNWMDHNSARFNSSQGQKAPLGASPTVDNPFDLKSVKALFTGASSTSAGAFVVNDRTNIFDMGPIMRPLGLIDLFRRVPTTSDTVEYVRVTSFTNNAAFTSEATSLSTGAKPQSDAALEIVTELVQNVAHWMAVTRRALADAPMVRGLINELLMYGLNEEIEDILASGNGIAPNLTGLSNQSGTISQAYDTDMLVTTRKARTKVRLEGRARPNAYVMHPNDWEAIDLLTDNENRYIFGGPSVIGTPRLWGLPVIENEAITEGSPWCADWNWGVVFDREQASMYMTDSHSDLFIRNIIVILAELRLAFGLIRPEAFVNIDLTA